MLKQLRWELASPRPWCLSCLANSGELSPCWRWIYCHIHIYGRFHMLTWPLLRVKDRGCHTLLKPYETNCDLWIWAIQTKLDWLIDWGKYEAGDGQADQCGIGSNTPKSDLCSVHVLVRIPCRASDISLRVERILSPISCLIWFNKLLPLQIKFNLLGVLIKKSQSTSRQSLVQALVWKQYFFDWRYSM